METRSWDHRARFEMGKLGRIMGLCCGGGGGEKVIWGGCGEKSSFWVDCGKKRSIWVDCGKNSLFWAVCGKKPPFNDRRVVLHFGKKG